MKQSRDVPLIAATAVLWASICSTHLYKTWYIAAAIAVVTVLVAVFAGHVDTRGLGRAMLPVLAYFALLLLTAAWAAYPRETLRWVAIDSIEIVVFALFFLAARNSTPHAIACAIATLAIPAVIWTIVDYHAVPFVQRLASYSYALLPIVIAFAAAGASMSRRKWPFVLAMLACAALLLISRHRAGMAAALLTGGVSLVAFSDTWRVAMRRAAAALAALVVIALLLAAFPATRPMVLTSFLRVMRVLPDGPLHDEVAQYDREIRATPYWHQVRRRSDIGDRARTRAVARALAPSALPLGIGYMNFQRHVEKTQHVPLSLHNMYAAWYLEGGVAVLLLAIVCLGRVLAGVWRHARDAYGMALLVSLIATLLTGIFHQQHQRPALWMLLALGAALITSHSSAPPGYSRTPETPAGG